MNCIFYLSTFCLYFQNRSAHFFLSSPQLTMKLNCAFLFISGLILVGLQTYPALKTSDLVDLEDLAIEDGQKLVTVVEDRSQGWFSKKKDKGKSWSSLLKNPFKSKPKLKFSDVSKLSSKTSKFKLPNLSLKRKPKPKSLPKPKIGKSLKPHKHKLKGSKSSSSGPAPASKASNNPKSKPPPIIYASNPKTLLKPKIGKSLKPHKHKLKGSKPKIPSQKT